MRADEVTESLVSLYNHFRYSHRKVPKAALKPSRKTLVATNMQTVKKIFVLFFGLIVYDTYSCDCKPLKAVKEAVSTSDLVIHGKIIKATYNKELDHRKSYVDTLQKVYQKTWYTDKNVNEYIVVVQKSYKGANVNDTIIIRTGLGTNDCGLILNVGSEFIFYASALKYGDIEYDNSKQKSCWTSSCTRTTPFDKKEEIEIIKIIGSH